MDKRWIYEEAMRMPFMVHYPDAVKAGSTSDWLIDNTDLKKQLRQTCRDLNETDHKYPAIQTIVDTNKAVSDVGKGNGK
jgi:uncharacterized sulfatase